MALSCRGLGGRTGLGGREGGEEAGESGGRAGTSCGSQGELGSAGALSSGFETLG